MTDHGRKPFRWANDLNTILTAFAGDGRFPVPVDTLAREFSALRFPGEPIVDVKGGSLGSFEGALYPVHDGKGWAIIYNSDVTGGRQRFTIAHELGHYLMHRPLLPKGIECSEDVVTYRDGSDLEHEADTFAASLLMPLDDFRKQLPPDAEPSLDDLSGLAERYGVSLISCILRWLEYTHRRSMIVISRDDFILWSKASDRAFKSGLFFRTRGVPPVPVPAASMIALREFADLAREGVMHPPGVWFGEGCNEITLHSDKYDQSVTILHFGRDSRGASIDEEPPEADTFDRFSAKPRERLE